MFFYSPLERVGTIYYYLALAKVGFSMTVRAERDCVLDRILSIIRQAD
jgi:hypothetical protein